MLLTMRSRELAGNIDFMMLLKRGQMTDFSLVALVANVDEVQLIGK